MSYSSSPTRLIVQILTAWDEILTKDIRYAFITHVQSNTGVQLPVAEIIALARERGIITIIDVAQSAGVLPIDISSWNADFVIGSCVKWLCGGPGAGYLWANPGILAECEPIDVGWFSHEDPFEFDIHKFRFATDAKRFWGGTPSVLPYVIAQNSIELLCELGINNIRQHNTELTEIILENVPGKNIINPVEVERRGGTLILNFSDKQSKVCEGLLKNGIHFDARSQGLRISPHIYNSLDDVALLIDCIKKNI